jgi:hypothetical protein
MSSSREDRVLREEERSIESQDYDQDDRDFIAPEEEEEESSRISLATADVLTRDLSIVRASVSLRPSSAMMRPSPEASALKPAYFASCMTSRPSLMALWRVSRKGFISLQQNMAVNTTLLANDFLLNAAAVAGWLGNVFKNL